MSGSLVINIPSPGGGVIGRQRISDDENPLPQDRIFCDYSFFHDAYLVSPADVNRIVPGFEKTFLDGRMSVEMRFPMAIMESNNIVADEPGFGNTGQFGNLEIIVKGIIAQRDIWTLSGGMGISVPTAPDENVNLADGTQLIKVANQSTHLLPFFALLVRPDDRWFGQAFVQVNVAANGDAVSANLGNGLTPIADIYDQTLLFVNGMVGRWMYTSPNNRFRLATVLEAHYTGGLNVPSAVQAGGFVVGNNSARFSAMDLTIGGHAVVNNTTFSLGFATPVTDERFFEGELRFFVNQKF